MNNKTILIVLLLSLLALPISAQLIPFSLEVRAGANFTEMDTKNTFDLDKKTSYRIEALADYKPLPFLFLRSGVTFSEKNAKISEEGIGDINGDAYLDISKMSGKIKAQYVQVPLMVGAKVSIPFLFSVNAAVGGYAAYGVGGKYKNNIYSAHSTIPISTNTTNLTENDFPRLTSSIDDYDTFGDDIYKRFDGGLIFSAGVEYNRVTLNAGYEYGLVNLVKKGDGTVKNRNLFVTLGFRIL